MARTAPEAGHLLLVGDPGTALDVAAGMIGDDPRRLPVREASIAALERLRRSDRSLVMVDVPVDLDDLLARLRGRAVGDRASDDAPIVFDKLVGRTVADVERALILQTLAHCHGNRTSAANVLGISVRTMRNKLRTFIEDGIPVQPAS